MVTPIPVAGNFGLPPGLGGGLCAGMPCGVKWGCAGAKKDPDLYPKACPKAVGCLRRAMLTRAALLPPFSECPGNEALTFGDFLGAVIGVCIYSAPFCAAV